VKPLPAGVSLRPDSGGLQFITQRGYFAPPFTSCMFASLATVLEFMGLDLPVPRRESKTPPENFVLTLHKASGAPLVRGTTTRESQKALRALFPYGTGVHFGLASDAALLKLLEVNAARVMVSCGKLPRPLRRWIGYGYEGGHAVALGGVQGTKVFYMDPMGRPATGYRGEWVELADISEALFRSGGKVIAAWGKKGEAEKHIMDELARQLEAAERALTASHDETEAAEAHVARLQQQVAGIHTLAQQLPPIVGAVLDASAEPVA
jgi:hypothetical protein